MLLTRTYHRGGTLTLLPPLRTWNHMRVPLRFICRTQPSCTPRLFTSVPDRGRRQVQSGHRRTLARTLAAQSPGPHGRDVSLDGRYPIFSTAHIRTGADLQQHWNDVYQLVTGPLWTNIASCPSDVELVRLVDFMFLCIQNCLSFASHAVKASVDVELRKASARVLLAAERLQQEICDTEQLRDILECIASTLTDEDCRHLCDPDTPYDYRCQAAAACERILSRFRCYSTYELQASETGAGLSWDDKLSYYQSLQARDKQAQADVHRMLFDNAPVVELCLSDIIHDPFLAEVAQQEPGQDPELHLNLFVTKYLLSNHPDTSLRKQIHEFSLKTRWDCFMDLMDEILAARYKQSRCQGYETFAHWRLVDSLLGDPLGAISFLENLAAALKPVADVYVHELALYQSQLTSWDHEYTQNEIVNVRCRLNPTSCELQLQLPDILLGLSDLLGQLFGLDLRPCSAIRPDASDVITLHLWRRPNIPVGTLHLETNTGYGTRVLRYPHVAIASEMRSEADAGLISGAMVPQVAADRRRTPACSASHCGGNGCQAASRLERQRSGGSNGDGEWDGKGQWRSDGRVMAMAVAEPETAMAAARAAHAGAVGPLGSVGLRRILDRLAEASGEGDLTGWPLPAVVPVVQMLRDNDPACACAEGAGTSAGAGAAATAVADATTAACMATGVSEWNALTDARASRARSVAAAHPVAGAKGEPLEIEDALQSMAVSKQLSADVGAGCGPCPDWALLPAVSVGLQGSMVLTGRDVASALGELLHEMGHAIHYLLGTGHNEYHHFHASQCCLEVLETLPAIFEHLCMEPAPLAVLLGHCDLLGCGGASCSVCNSSTVLPGDQSSFGVVLGGNEEDGKDQAVAQVVAHLCEAARQRWYNPVQLQQQVLTVLWDLLCHAHEGPPQQGLAAGVWHAVWRRWSSLADDGLTCQQVDALLRVVGDGCQSSGYLRAWVTANQLLDTHVPLTGLAASKQDGTPGGLAILRTLVEPGAKLSGAELLFNALSTGSGCGPGAGTGPAATIGSGLGASDGPGGGARTGSSMNDDCQVDLCLRPVTAKQLERWLWRDRPHPGASGQLLSV